MLADAKLSETKWDRLHIFAIVGNDAPMTEEEGQKVFEAIVSQFKRGTRFYLAFGGVRFMAVPFLQKSIGQLYGHFSEEYIRENLELEDFPDCYKFSLEKVVENAKYFYRDKEEAERRLQESIKDIQNDNMISSCPRAMKYLRKKNRIIRLKNIYMDLLKKMEGYKTKTGITLLVVTAFAYLGYDVTQADAITFVDAVTGLAVLLSGMLANYGANDKEKRAIAMVEDERYRNSLALDRLRSSVRPYQFGDVIDVDSSVEEKQKNNGVTEVKNTVKESPVAKNQHVVPRANGWAVKTAGASRDTKVYKTQDEAINRATEIAKNNKSELVVHGATGKIIEINSFVGHSDTIEQDGVTEVKKEVTKKNTRAKKNTQG